MKVNAVSIFNYRRIMETPTLAYFAKDGIVVLSTNASIIQTAFEYQGFDRSFI